MDLPSTRLTGEDYSVSLCGEVAEEDVDLAECCSIGFFTSFTYLATDCSFSSFLCVLCFNSFAAGTFFYSTGFTAGDFDYRLGELSLLLNASAGFLLT